MYCFRFNSRAQFRTLAAAEGLITAENELITASHTFAIDEIGIITEGGMVLKASPQYLTRPTLGALHQDFRLLRLD
jgi:hypothetical protein